MPIPSLNVKVSFSLFQYFLPFTAFEMPKRAKRARRARNAKPVVPAATGDGSSSTPNNANRKRKAEETLDSPRSPSRPKIEQSGAETGTALEQTADPTANDSATKDPETAKAEASEDKIKSVSTFVREGKFQSWCTLVVSEFGEFQSLQEMEDRVEIAREGHRAREGILEAIYVSLRARGFQYCIVIHNPYTNQAPQRTIAHECMETYINESRRALELVLMPICEPVWEEEKKHPMPDDFETFLPRAVTYFRLVPETGTLELCPEFEATLEPEYTGEPVDWGMIMKGWIGDFPTWKLSDVKSFRVNTASKYIYEVEIDGMSEPLIYKFPKSSYHVMVEVAALRYCAEVNIRAPRVVGLIGVDTEWGGLLITKIPTVFQLGQYGGRRDHLKPSLSDRRRWYAQISDAVHALHRRGLIWGDAKPDNVVIDEKGDAVLLDFEGGWTRDWIDDELEGTKEGDLQALKRIRTFLKLDDEGGRGWLETLTCNIRSLCQWPS
ncbi:hypothetical protein BDW74DRAFT_154898 [Aspergillus multicolor]|uniref:uncharacterized protein n=1 Tax=Aspergillus multicolor TaxID=41759 RepID=UPI003CCD3960